MDQDDQEQSPLEAGLEAAQDSHQIIVAELRLMAAGDDRYHRFIYMSPWIKNIWSAAADIIEDTYRNRIN